MLEQGERDPQRPGWYPTGDGHYQRYYDGRLYGWTDFYTVEIQARDPRRPPSSRQSMDQVLALIGFTLAAVVVGIAFALLAL